MLPPVRVVAFTDIDPFKIEGYRDYCSDHFLDPKTAIGFSRFCTAHGADASAMMTLAVSGDFPSAETATVANYGLLSFAVGKSIIINGTLLSWGLFFKRQPNAVISKSVMPILNSLSMYALYEG